MCDHDEDVLDEYTVKAWDDAYSEFLEDPVVYSADYIREKYL